MKKITVSLLSLIFLFQTDLISMDPITITGISPFPFITTPLLPQRNRSNINNTLRHQDNGAEIIDTEKRVVQPDGTSFFTENLPPKLDPESLRKDILDDRLNIIENRNILFLTGNPITPADEINAIEKNFSDNLETEYPSKNYIEQTNYFIEKVCEDGCFGANKQSLKDFRKNILNINESMTLTQFLEKMYDHLQIINPEFTMSFNEFIDKVYNHALYPHIVALAAYLKFAAQID